MYTNPGVNPQLYINCVWWYVLTFRLPLLQRVRVLGLASGAWVGMQFPLRQGLACSVVSNAGWTSNLCSALRRPRSEEFPNLFLKRDLVSQYPPSGYVESNLLWACLCSLWRWLVCFTLWCLSCCDILKTFGALLTRGVSNKVDHWLSPWDLEGRAQGTPRLVIELR